MFDQNEFEKDLNELLEVKSYATWRVIQANMNNCSSDNIKAAEAEDEFYVKYQNFLNRYCK